MITLDPSGEFFYNDNQMKDLDLIQLDAEGDEVLISEFEDVAREREIMFMICA